MNESEKLIMIVESYKNRWSKMQLKTKVNQEIKEMNKQLIVEKDEGKIFLLKNEINRLTMLPDDILEMHFKSLYYSRLASGYRDISHAMIKEFVEEHTDFKLK